MAAGTSIAAADGSAQMLLYLNSKTFVDAPGMALADEVRCARANGVPLVMLHETDPTAGGCEFALFFKTTPPDIIAGSLFHALHSRTTPAPTSRGTALVAKALGAVEGRRGVAVARARRAQASPTVPRPCVGAAPPACCRRLCRRTTPGRE